MAKRVCPWWLGYFLACPLRRLTTDPHKLLQPYIRAGMTVLEPGPGMGFFTVEIARLAGPDGRVVAVDVQPKMLASLKKRAARAGLLARVETRLATADSLGVADLAGVVDFTLAWAVVHEMPSANAFFSQVAGCSRPGATLLFSEPSGHVKQRDFEEEAAGAVRAGFEIAERLPIRRTHAVLLRKKAGCK